MYWSHLRHGGARSLGAVPGRGAVVYRAELDERVSEICQQGRIFSGFFLTSASQLPAVVYHGTRLQRSRMRSEGLLTKPHKVEGLSQTVKPIVITSYEIAMHVSAFYARFPA